MYDRFCKTILSDKGCELLEEFIKDTYYDASAWVRMFTQAY